MDVLHALDVWLLIGAVLVLAGIASSLVATRFGAPMLLVFLALGMLAGEDGFGGIAFDDFRLTYAVGSLALAVILFDGGLRTRLDQVRGAIAPSIILASLGVVLTAGLTAAAANYLLGLGWAESLLMGSILASTDAAAVFFLLRANGLHLQRRVGATLEIESSSNDPIAVFITLALIGVLSADTPSSYLAMALQLGRQVLLGALAGWAGGRLIAFALNRLELPSGLHPLLAVAGAIGVFALSNVLGGSGYLAVYLAGVVIGNRPVRAFANVLSVQDAATWLAQMVMFLVLGLLVTPTRLLESIWVALGVAAFLMFVARPLAVALCLAPFGFRKREISFISWVGLRGAVGIFLASIPMLVGLPNAQLYFNVAFVVVLVSLLVQGWSLSWAADLFGVAVPRRDPPSRRVELDLPGQLEYELVGYRAEEGAAVLHDVSRVPTWARPVLTVRDGKVLTPDQAGSLRAQDYAYFLAPLGRVIRLDWLFAEPAQAREVERAMFGEFSFDGNIPLAALADFYGLKVPVRVASQTAADLFASHFDEQPQIGDSLRVGGTTLVVRELLEDRVSRVGLKFAVARSGKGHRAAIRERLQRWRARFARKT